MEKLEEKADSSRMETGALQIGEDWPGLFIRGDDALYLLGIFRDLKYREASITSLNLETLFSPFALNFIDRLIQIIENEVKIK